MVQLLVSPQLRRFLIFSSAALVWIAGDLVLCGMMDIRGLRLLTAYLVPVFGGGMIWLFHRFSYSAKTANPSPRSAPHRGVAAAGLIFIAGGAVADVTTTLLHSPDLRLEANPYVRALLTHQHRLEVVYLYLGMTQVLYVVLFCRIWVDFLGQLPDLLASIVAAHPASRWEFLKAATGGAHLSMRQWLLPLKPSELPQLNPVMWSAALAIVFGISLFRWYVALEWLDVVRPALWPRLIVVLTGVSAALSLYFLVLGRLCRGHRPTEANVSR